MKKDYVSAFAKLGLAATMITGCLSSSSSTPADDSPSLRPGVEDSSQVFKGTPSPDESAFWVAVRNADDTGRANAISRLVANVNSDPSNGYSEFLVGANYFMPPRSVLVALANGTPPDQSRADPAAMPYLKQALDHLTDPFYLGFDGGFLGGIELAAGDTAEGGPTFATAQSYNHAATGVMSVIADLQMNNVSKALADMYQLVEFCNGGAVDHNGGDAASYVAKLNAGSLVHRECYSGYYAPHGSSGEMLILADLEALNGNHAAATAYYTALQNTSDYSTWPLKPLVERRLNGTQAPDHGTVTAITATCGTCHTSTLP